MTDPTDRERVAWELCETQWSSRCPESTPCSDCLRLADRAIALGAKPPIDPLEGLISEIGKWINQRDVVWQGKASVPSTYLADAIVRHVITRAKELGL